MTPAEVAALFGVDAKSVTRWSKLGRLTTVRTLGGHRRYRADQVRELLAAGTTELWHPAAADDKPEPTSAE